MAIADRRAKDALYDAFAAVGQALASGRRAELVDVLAQGERSVEELASEIDQSVANTSHHLRTLARAGLVTNRREGTRIYYRLASEEVERLWGSVRAVAARHAAHLEDRAVAYLGDRSEVVEMARRELLDRMQRGDVVVLDVRPAAEFAAGHIPGATQVDPADLEQHLGLVPEGAEVVAYCRGPYCAFADRAVRALEARGVRVWRLEDGFPEWRREGLPVETSEGEKTDAKRRIA